MQSLPLPARWYLSAILLIASLIGLALLPSLYTLAQAPLLAAGCLIGFIMADYVEAKLDLPGGSYLSMNVVDAVVIFLIATLGFGGIWLVAAGTAAVEVVRFRSWQRLWFNVASNSISFASATLIYGLLQAPDHLPFSGPAGVLTFVLVAVSAHTVNTLVVSTMVALASRQPLLQVYREGFQLVSWIHLLTFPLGAILAVLWKIDPWLLIFGVGALVIAQRAFTTVVALHGETRWRQELAEERARLYEELNAQKDELARNAKLAAMGTFAAGIAHEFNNVLTVIIGQAQVGSMGDTFAEKNYALDVIARVSQRACSITASLLTFSRHREPELHLSYIQEVVEDTIGLLERDLEKDQIELSRAIEEIPPLLCDTGQIAQVVLNLVTNARDALREQGGGQISISLVQDGAQALLTIADNGPGIPPDVLEKIFQPFVTTKRKGNGLGMAICYGIIESHRGKIEIASALGKGTTVTIRLPLGGALLDPAEGPLEVAGKMV